MAKHKGLPKPAKLALSKAGLLRTLSEVDVDAESPNRVLAMETEFRRRVSSHIGSLPTSTARFSKFNTNPFVLLIHSMQKGYRQIAEIEQDILPAKLFSSMETSAGRMVEAVVLPAYGWEVVASAMHSSESVVDGKRRDGDVLRLASLKSGPRCLNDEMSKDIAQDILNNCSAWAALADVKVYWFSVNWNFGPRSLRKAEAHPAKKFVASCHEGLSLWRQNRSGERSGAKECFAPTPVSAPGAALGSHLCVALSSVQVV